MFTSSFPVAHRLTGIGTAATDVARLLAADAVPAIDPTGYDTASSVANPMATEFEQSVRRFLDTSAPRPLRYSRFDAANSLGGEMPNIAHHAFGRTPCEASQEAIEIPPIWCPLPLRSRGDGMKFQRRTEEFYRSMGFDAESLNTVREVCAGEAACMWAAMGDDEGVQLLSDWLGWVFLFDDGYCDEGPLSRDPTAFNHLALNLMNFALYPERSPLGIPYADALGTALADMMARVRARSGGEQVLAWTLAFYRYALGTACGVSDRSGYYIRSVDQHMIARPADGADLLTIYTPQIAEGTWFDPAASQDPATRAATDVACALLSMLTDLAAYGHERSQQSLESNIVQMIAVERRCSPQEAMYAACALMEEIMELFISLKDKLSAHGTRDLRRYLEQLSNIVRGVVEWQRRTPRYAKHFDITAPPPAPGKLLDTPFHAISDHRLFPSVEPPQSIRWWWDFV
ncbi:MULTISPECIES: hypothetical protein [unclassified Nocardia]|uniref:terpene synthase family protein n=1 Tax=unclassified Nocardia TaxID=2637762 RepID=UPI001CE47CB3|nr:MULTISPECIES: hypothetical protein [unclassified Nocardia]